MPKGKHARPDQIDVETEAKLIDLRIKVLQLKAAGLSYRSIGTRLKINHETARTYALDALKELKALEVETAEDYRTLELNRLDRLQAAWWNRAIGGTLEDKTVIEPNENAAKLVIRFMDMRAKLLGLYPKDDVVIEMNWESLMLGHNIGTNGKTKKSP